MQRCFVTSSARKFDIGSRVQSAQGCGRSGKFLKNISAEGVSLFQNKQSDRRKLFKLR
jgi:hypothetical protein